MDRLEARNTQSDAIACSALCPDTFRRSQLPRLLPDEHRRHDRSAHFHTMITDQDLGDYSIIGGFLVMALILVYHYTTAPKTALETQ